MLAAHLIRMPVDCVFFSFLLFSSLFFFFQKCLLRLNEATVTARQAINEEINAGKIIPAMANFDGGRLYRVWRCLQRD